MTTLLDIETPDDAPNWPQLWVKTALQDVISARNYVPTYFFTLGWKSGTDKYRLHSINNDFRHVEVFRWAAVVVKSLVIYEYSYRLWPWYAKTMLRCKIKHILDAYLVLLLSSLQSWHCLDCILLPTSLSSLIIIGDNQWNLAHHESLCD